MVLWFLGPGTCEGLLPLRHGEAPGEQAWPAQAATDPIPVDGQWRNRVSPESGIGIFISPRSSKIEIGATSLSLSLDLPMVEWFLSTHISSAWNEP